MSNQEHDESLISTLSERIWNGLAKENPTFVLLLGMCPTLAVTTSAINGLGMGVTTLIVLALSNFMISALRKVIPDKVRIPAFIVIIASFVTIVELLLKAYIPSLYDALGLYIPLIVVNCIILGRAESYAYSHKVLPSLFDGIGMGMGFTLALTIIGGFREILGSGKIFDYPIMPSGFVPVSIFVMAPGAFFVLAMLTALQNLIKDAGTKRGKDMSKIQSGCGGNCMDCSKECADRGKDLKESKKEKKAKEKSKSKPEINDTAEAKAKPDLKTDELKEAKPVNKSDVKDEANVIEKTEVKSEAKTEVNAEVKPEVKNEEPEEKADNKIADAIVTEKVEAPKEEKALDTSAKEVKADEPKEAKSEAKKPKAEKVKAEKPKTEKPKTEKTKAEKAKQDKAKTSENANQEEDELVLLDLNDYKKAISKTTPSGKKPVRKKASIEKAQAMLSKANDSLKEDKNND